MEGMYQQKYILVCEDSLDGIFTAVYDGWKYAVQGNLVEIRTEEPENLELFCTIESISTDREKSAKVGRSIYRTLGRLVYEDLCFAASAVHDRKGTAIFHTLFRALSRGRCNRRILQEVADPDIHLVTKLRIRAWNNYHHYLGFVRFREVGGGVLFARITPDCDILEMLGGHFADRFPNENWMIFDAGRDKVLLHPRQGPCTVQREVRLSEKYGAELAEAEVYEELWRAFTASIAITERSNPKLQQQFLPLKYRGNMPEFL